ncbi:unnamed protein product [Amaranthus hypochondriacus]
MKFTPSSSVSSSSASSTTSSSSSSSFRENFCTNKGNTFGCFAGVLSRILCSKSFPTHPSVDPIDSHKNIQDDGSTTPNVVAKLMGLDSMPEFNSNSIVKSKSFDSEDFREKTEEMQHRRVKTSVSFRETPDYFELQDDDFFIFSFENKKKGSNMENSEVGSKGNHKHRRRRRDKCGKKWRKNRQEQSKERVFSDEDRLSLKIFPPKNDAFFDVHKQSYHLSPLKEKLEENKERKKNKNENCLGKSKDEVECDSENLSPVSVLDHNSEFTSDPELTTSEEDARLRRSECDSINHSPSQSNENENDGRETKNRRNKEKDVGFKRKDYKKHENVEMLRRICKLAENEVNNSNWKYRRMLSGHELEDTAQHFGQRIFDQLLNELLDQLLGFQYHQI